MPEIFQPKIRSVLSERDSPSIADHRTLSKRYVKCIRYSLPDAGSDFR